MANATSQMAFVLLLWTAWLIAALPMLAESVVSKNADTAPVIVVTALGLLGAFVALGITLAFLGGVTWRSYLMAWLIIHLLAAIAVALLERQPYQAALGSASAAGLACLGIWPFAGTVGIAAGVLTIFGVGTLLGAEYFTWLMLKEVRCRRNRQSSRPRSTAVAPDNPILEDRRPWVPPPVASVPRPGPRRRIPLAPYYTRLASPVGESTVATQDAWIAEARVLVKQLPASDRKRGPRLSGVSSGPPRRRVRIVVEHRTSQIRPEPGETVGELIQRCETRLQHEAVSAITDSTADRISEPAWQFAAEGWVTGQYPLDRIVSGSTQLESGIHELLLGRPAQLAASLSGLSEPESNLIRAVTSAAPIATIDRPLSLGRTIIEISTIVLGAIAHNPSMVGAGLKSFAHDTFTREFAKGIEEALNKRALAGRGQGPREPGGERTREVFDRGRRTPIERREDTRSRRDPHGSQTRMQWGNPYSRGGQPSSVDEVREGREGDTLGDERRRKGDGRERPSRGGFGR